MTRLSILIPKSPDTVSFEDTLASVLANRPVDCEVVALCPGGYDDPYCLADEVRFLRVPLDAPLPAMINQVLFELEGEVLHLLSCGVRVPEDWTSAALHCFAHPQVAAVTPLLVNASGRDVIQGVRRGWLGDRRLVAGKHRSPRRRAHGPTRCAAFYRRSILTEFGGFDESLGDSYFDLDIALTIQQSGYRSVVLPESMLMTQATPDANASGFAEGRLRERLFWKHARSSGLALHPLTWLCEAVALLPSGHAPACLAGRLWELLQTPLSAAHRQSPSDRLPGTISGDSTLRRSAA